jgi:hypothetical protein
MKTCSSALPFSGLGFDLAPVSFKARLMIWRRMPHTPGRVSEKPAYPAPAAYGYELLVRLSREIRGS